MTDGKPEFLLPDGVHAPPANTYSHAVVAGGVVYVAGQVGIDPSGKLLEGFEAQATQALENLSAVLTAAGAKLGDVVKVQVLVSEPSDAATYRGLREKYLPQRPASTLYAPKAFAIPGLLFEIEAIAVPSSR
ncbi:RidA family protein [Mycolicibacterium chlorophenolicum]|uniref:Enamine/imine deaminase n=1 Tax=Mycolicibacterium chlorophenolicum TaxID=37916 RepID=A0A0J6V7Z3_9MYCO|nr:RidA family protein [Mycolicibacterium chlorophenolicum]KMO66970.1 Enamine/imine deaminase [Mycolicibacterium chlorophenolicum]